jgi:hypothetical protein
LPDKYLQIVFELENTDIVESARELKYKIGEETAVLKKIEEEC